MGEKKRLKLRPHYLWLGGIFILGGLIVSIIQSREPESTHAAGQGIQDGMYMQDITPDICANTPIGNTQYTVIDKRDEKSYTVARIANKEGGKAHCWMTSNLAFDIQNQASKMTNEFSDVTDNKTSWASGVSIKLNAYTDTNPGNTGAAYTNAAPTVTASGSGAYQPATYGFYYTWCAATAGDCDITTNQPSARSANISICPKGWKLPIGGSGGQFTDLFGADASNSGITVTPHATAAPYNYLLSGYMFINGFNNGGIVGAYWSSSSKSNLDVYVLNVQTSTVSPTSGGSRYIGRSVRCVAEAPSGFGGVYAMQDMTADVCANAKETTGTLVDRRDGKIYSVAKIADKVGDGENCWMTQNLQLDLEQYWNASTMTTALSDVPSDDYWTQRNIGAATKKNQGFTTNTSNYNSIEYTNTTTTGSGDNKLKVAGGAYKADYGYYYTWCAATVGCKDSSGNIPSSGDVVASICPKGWQLPSGNASGQWYNLLNGTSKPYIDNLADEPYKIPAAGGMYSSGLVNGGTSGIYWSRTAYDANVAYYLSFNSSNFNQGTGIDTRYYGFSVRCVNNPDVHGLPESPNKDFASADFSVVVNDAITLSSVEFSNSDGTSNTISAMPGQLATGSINVNVGSNVKYKITMNSTSPDLTSSNQSDPTNIIPAITTAMTADQLKSNYGWGVLKKNSDNITDDTVYTGLNSQDQTFYTSDELAGASKVTNFGVGVGVPPTIPADTYSTEVTITAIATE